MDNNNNNNNNRRNYNSRSNNNNNRRRSSRYSNNRNYQYNRNSTTNTNTNNLESSSSNKINSSNKRNEYRENRKRDLSVDENYSITKQQKFDFDEMKFSDEIDTSFVENKRKKKKEIVDDLAKSYEKVKEEQEKREKHSHGKLRVGRVIVIIVILALLLALLIASIFVVLKPDVKTKVVTKEKEVVIIDDNYLFLGGSITEQYDLDEYYPDMFVVNSGISGNQTQDILDDMKERVYQYNPSKVFLLIGTNDIQAGVEEEDIVNNICEILKDIKENRPYAELYLEAIYPVDEDLSGAQTRTNEEIESINSELKKFCKEEDVTYINTYELLLDEDGEKLNEDYTKDGLHITDEGYEVITKELEKYMK